MGECAMLGTFTIATKPNLILNSVQFDTDGSSGLPDFFFPYICN